MHMVPGIEPGLAVFKASALSPILSVRLNSKCEHNQLKKKKPELSPWSTNLRKAEFEQLGPVNRFCFVEFNLKIKETKIFYIYITSLVEHDTCRFFKQKDVEL